MKLQIDTVAKTIKLEQSAKIADIINVVKKLLPNDWKDYSLEAVEVIVHWNNPYTYTPYLPSYESPFIVTCNNPSETLYNIQSIN
jgi:hypothetical protein